MKKITLILSIIFLGLVTAQSQNTNHKKKVGLSMEIEINDYYKIYAKIYDKQLKSDLINKMSNGLYNAGYIDTKITSANSIDSNKEIDGDLVYQFSMNGDKLIIYLSESLLSKKEYNTLLDISQDVYKLVESAKDIEKETSEKLEEKYRDKSKSVSSSESYSVNVSIENTENMYTLTAKYDEKGQHARLIRYLNSELGGKNIKINGTRHVWKRTFEGDEPLFFMVDKGRFEIKVNKSYLSQLDFIDYLDIADHCKELLSKGPSVPKPPKTPRTPNH